MADFDAFETAAQPEVDPAAEFLAREQDELAGLEDVEEPQPSQNGLDAFGDDSPAAPQAEEPQNGVSNAYSAISQQDAVRAEPEKLRIWKEEQKERLEAKDQEEEKKKQELRDSAKKELDDWYRHHQEQLDKSKETNRAAESAFVKDRDETIPGQAWEKISKLCEFNPKNSKTTKDVSRLRSILLQLKQTPLVR